MSKWLKHWTIPDLSGPRESRFWFRFSFRVGRTYHFWEVGV